MIPYHIDMESLVVEGIVSNLEMDGKTRVSVASMENGVLYDGGGKWA